MNCPTCQHVHQKPRRCSFPVWTQISVSGGGRMVGNIPCQCKVNQGGMKIGFLFRKYSAWIGWHYSEEKRRHCINLIPFCTIWITKRGGQTP